MLRYQQQFDFFDEKKINESIYFINLADATLSGDLNKILDQMIEYVAKYNPGFVFVDSFRAPSSVENLKESNAISIQDFMQQLAILMTNWQATTFLIGEYLDDTEPNPAFTTADGIFWLRQSVQRNSVVRKLEITKMRGQPTAPGLHSFRINLAGIKVFTQPSLSTQCQNENTWPVNERQSMGVAELDEMMNGGLPRGYSLLVAGPSGSGKSLLAASFLTAGAAVGETGVIAAFEQRANSSRGAVIVDLIERDLIGVVNTRASVLSVDEISMLVIEEIQRLGASRVVIDSLSGFELTLAPTFREDFRESIALMMSAFASTGATVLITSEMEDRYDDLRFSPYGTAFLTDAIIVQRYIEVESSLQRVIAVVKMRASNHSSALRLFYIDDDGLHIGEKLVDHEGLLSGRPTRRPNFESQLVDEVTGAADGGL